MNAGTFHRRRELGQRGRVERQPLVEREGLSGVAGRQQRQRNRRRRSFFATQACPECGIDDRFDGLGVWFNAEVETALADIAAALDTAGQQYLQAEQAAAGLFR